MSDRTAIAWTDATWNPIRGCSRVSTGCRNCYAEKVAARFHGSGQPYEGLTTAHANGGRRWNGTVKLVPEKLDQPIRWKRPRRIFVNSMSDLFHEAIGDEYIDEVFAAMALAPQHVFQILTKRPERMREYVCEMYAGGIYGITELAASRFGGEVNAAMGQLADGLPNAHLGVSIEDQATADERIPFLLDTPAAVRFVSVEPMLAPVDLRHIDADSAGHEWCQIDTLTGRQTDMGRPCPDVSRLDWVIVGGESGPGARPCEMDWIESIVAQCKAAGVPCFVKQLGSVLARRMGLKHRAGADPAEWPTPWPQEFPARSGLDWIEPGG